ncbi:polymorphic toxin type 15 domain-containing protein [Fulvimarina sp. MAC8]|uniref:polymorphic toxin type 15 domain-containing protein n=1 Tax=Fulvimarina sp. MAC8 TaxID=3162874 RepID=UPI0032EF680A
MGLDIAILAKKDAADALQGITPEDTQEQSLFDDTHARLTKHIEDAYFNPLVSPDQDYIRRERDYLSDLLEKRRKAKKKPKPLPVPPPPPGGNTRISEDSDRKCRTLIICFMPRKSSIDREEFKRQMELQQDGLNRMTPQQMLDNRGRYVAQPEMMRALSKPLQSQARNEYLTTQRIQKRYRDKYGPVRGPIELQNYVKAAAALHNPDMVAGGTYSSVMDQSLPIEDRIGRLIENSSMGSQWINPKVNGNTRASRLAKHAAQQAKNNCPIVQVDLRLCESVPTEPGKPKTEQ